MSLTWYRWLEMGRDVQATASTLQSIAHALELDVDERAYLLTLASDLPPVRAGVPDIDDAMLAVLVRGFRDGPAYVVNRRWNVVASNQLARDYYGFVPSPAIDGNVLWRLVHDTSLRSVHEDPDTMIGMLCGLVRYNYADDPKSIELAELHRALRDAPAFAQAWDAYSVRTFSPLHVRIRHGGRSIPLTFVALSVGHLGHETLVLHLPQER